MLYVALASILIAIVMIWRVASVFHKMDQLVLVNRQQRKVIDALVKANERQQKLEPLFEQIDKAKSAQDYSDLYSSIISS